MAGWSSVFWRGKDNDNLLLDENEKINLPTRWAIFKTASTKDEMLSCGVCSVKGNGRLLIANLWCLSKRDVQ
jgi:hypothetical protein